MVEIKEVEVETAEHFFHRVGIAVIQRGVRGDTRTNLIQQLDGFWHLERIDTLATGGVNNTADDYLFWCVQSRLVEVGDRRDGYKPGILFSFRHEGSVLSFYNPLHSDRANGDRPVEDVDDLRPYGINEMEEHFDVETLNGSKMVLRSKVLRLVFKKF